MNGSRLLRAFVRTVRLDIANETLDLHQANDVHREQVHVQNQYGIYMAEVTKSYKQCIAAIAA
jgi:hypothetical protein